MTRTQNPRRTGRVRQLVGEYEKRLEDMSKGGQKQPEIKLEDMSKGSQKQPEIKDDDATLIEGLTPSQLTVLAQKVYDLMLDELRLEAERNGRRNVW